jgi:hypothetical protein
VAVCVEVAARVVMAADAQAEVMWAAESTVVVEPLVATDVRVPEAMGVRQAMGTWVEEAKAVVAKPEAHAAGRDIPEMTAAVRDGEEKVVVAWVAEVMAVGAMVVVLRVAAAVVVAAAAEMVVVAWAEEPVVDTTAMTMAVG